MWIPTLLQPITWIATFAVLATFHIPTTMATNKKTATFQEQTEVAASLEKFSLDIYKAIARQRNASQDIFISPFSIAVVLSMAGVGARGNTGVQLKKSLGLSNFSDEKISLVMGNLIKDFKSGEYVTLEAANRIYVADKYEITESFQTILKENYGAPAQNLDFALDVSRISINNWVEKFTKRRIKELIPEGAVGPSTKVVLANALYFKGNWEKTFYSFMTKMQPFVTASNEKPTYVNTMHHFGSFRSGFVDSLDARILELPFEGDKLSMMIVLPNKQQGLSELEAKIHENSLANIEMKRAEMQVAIPKFKLEADLDLKDVLIEMGMPDAFDEKTADFSGISAEKDLFVSGIFHKSFIDVNEGGCEAAAATTSFLTGCILPPDDEPPPFIADHPFFFFIRDNLLKLTIFSGRLVQPPTA